MDRFDELYNPRRHRLEKKKRSPSLLDDFKDEEIEDIDDSYLDL